MTSTSIGDLAQTMANRMQVSRLKSSLGTLTNELATGKKEDIGTQVRGEYSAISALEGALKTLASYEVSVREGALMLDSAQVALTNIYDLTVETGPNLVLTSDLSDPAMVQAAGQDAAQQLATIVSSLNLSVAGRSAFSGAATGTPPLVSADEILDELSILIAGAATPEDAQLLIDGWFNDAGGGFETIAYQGSTSNMSAIPVGEGESVTYSVTAADQAVRDVLASFATAALISKGAFAGDAEAQTELLASAGEAMLSAETGFSVLQAEVGSQQAFLEDAALRIDTSQNAYQIALNEIYASDPYEVATQLEAIALQLETMYAVTSRLSNLSMTEYLR